MPPRFAPPAADALPLTLVDPEGLGAVLAALDPSQAAWVRAQGFAAAAGEVVVLPGAGGSIAGALAGLGKAAQRARARFHGAGAAARLPEAVWRVAGAPEGVDLGALALGWLFEGYRFDRYHKAEAPRARLVAPEGVDAARLEVIAAAEWLARDLINTPACDMGPAELEAAARAAVGAADVRVIRGDDLLAQGFPLIHAVGRAAAPGREPRLIDVQWGADGPLLTLVGKGVCFDTGGLDIKPASSMGLMKKDMGGAATALGLAQAIIALRLPLRLRLLIPAVENAIGSACVPAAGHPDQPQGADRRGEQHRCRGAAGAGRCAGAGGRGRAGPDGVLCDPDRRGEDGSRPRSGAVLHRP